MRLGIFTLIAALLVFVGVPLTASAGPVGCVGNGTDTDTDGTDDNCDNCSAIINAGQQDSNGDGFGNACDCDFDNDGDCDGTDFLAFGVEFNIITPSVATVPPADADMDMDSDLDVDGTDFLSFGQGFNIVTPAVGLPGPSCDNALAVPCP